MDKEDYKDLMLALARLERIEEDTKNAIKRIRMLKEKVDPYRITQLEIPEIKDGIISFKAVDCCHIEMPKATRCIIKINGNMNIITVKGEKNKVSEFC